MSTATYAQLTAEIASNIPSGNPTTLTAASLRRYLQDQIDSLNVAASAATSVNLSTYQPFVNTTNASASTVLLGIYDGAQEVDWATLNTSTHSIFISISGSIAAKNGTSPSSTGSQALQMGTTNNLGIFFGTGSVPTSTAAQGSLFVRTDGGSTSTRLYVMGSVGTWIPVTTAS